MALKIYYLNENLLPPNIFPFIFSAWNLFFNFQMISIPQFWHEIWCTMSNVHIYKLCSTISTWNLFHNFQMKSILHEIYSTKTWKFDFLDKMRDFMWFLNTESDIWSFEPGISDFKASTFPFRTIQSIKIPSHSKVRKDLDRTHETLCIYNCRLSCRFTSLYIILFVLCSLQWNVISRYATIY